MGLMNKLIGVALVLALPAGQAAIKEKVAACMECHGENGIATVSGYPHLAGQSVPYMVKQLEDFRSGARKSPFMAIVAAKLDPADLAGLAAYFAAFEANKGAGGTPDPVGRKLYTQGDRTRGIAACASCHGASGAGGAAIPVIGGQQMFYLREQLLNWHLGLRNNSPDRVMNKATDGLTEAEIDALARYIQGL